MNAVEQSLDDIVKGNIARAENEIQRSIAFAEAGVPLAAEPQADRAARRIERKASLNGSQAETIARSIHMAGQMAMHDIAALKAVLPGDEETAAAPGAPEKVWGGTFDFVSVSFLARGANAARAVARIANADGQPLGTGFLIGDGLFITNAHVLGTIADAQAHLLQFDYELGITGAPLQSTRFQIDAAIFVTHPVTGLDFTIVAVGLKVDGPANLGDYGFCGLSDAANKHMLGENVNIVQHPDGRFKEVVLRENKLVSRLDDVLLYVADTEPGSSGSPVFNNAWEVVALHHWGGISRSWTDASGRPVSSEVNEGIRISSIVRNLRQRLPGLPPATRSRIERVLQMGAENHAVLRPQSLDLPSQRQAAQQGAGMRVDSDGRATWTIPIEISVQLPHLASAAVSAPNAGAPAASINPPPPAPSTAAEQTPSTDYTGRAGYDPDFLPGFPIALPGLTPSRKRDLAISKAPSPGMPDYALPYQHFTIVMNRVRKLAFYTACNIDGSRAKSVNRRTKRVEPLRPDSPGLESFDGAEEMEASDRWFDDPRLDPQDYAGEDFYASQVLPDFPNGNLRTLNMFQRGHLVRRLDPCWGSDNLALAAELDSFHWTNCTPQVGFFNQGRAPADTPRSEQGALWRSVENFVLRNAVASAARVTCFTGPIFAVTDRPYRGVLIPERFFKVAVWVDQGELRSIAMIASQASLLGARREALAEGMTTFGTPGEIAKIDDFQVPVSKVEQETGIRFGPQVLSADIGG